MKLNNRGWGLREMLILSAILIFFFCLAIYFIYVLSSSLSTSSSINNEAPVNYTLYKNYEEKLYNAGEKFLLNNKSYQDSIINLSTLINAGYISGIKDLDTKNECNGYIKVYNLDEREIQAFIKCDNYITEGYIEKI